MSRFSGSGARPFLCSLPRVRGTVREGARSPVGVPPRLFGGRANAPVQLQALFLGRGCSAGVTGARLSQSSDTVADRS
jgi:hypothetical protein